MSRRLLLAMLMLGTLALGAGFGLRQYLNEAGRAPVIAGIYLPEARPMPTMALKDADGAVFGNAQLQGHWTVLAYGYTHCPDICPTTLASLAKAARRVRELDARAAEDFAYAFLTVDPARDTAARLKDYVPFFHPEFRALRSESGAPESLYKALGIVAILNPPDDPAKPGQYTVDHGVAMYAFDPQGRLRAILRPENAAQGAYDPERLAADLLAVRERG
ncbi:MAG: SCO family protein [Gammaproteobacteria bacterium]|nr:SCO family protein [Gammaproteobacteria bacterium]